MTTGRAQGDRLIETVRETGSTSADLAARLRSGELVSEGYWLVTDRQTAGRGRQGREWFDGVGNFMGSTVVHRRFGDPEPATLALVAGLALHEAVSPCLPVGTSAILKWPNDVMIADAKLAGILLEREGEAVIVGIGVNLASAPQLADRRTTALSAYGTLPDRDDFAATLARHFATEIERWRNFGMGAIINRWLAVATPVGTSLSTGGVGEAPLTGGFAGLADDGAMQLRLADGTVRVIHAGEVRLADRDR